MPQQTALIIGASRGLGLGLAREYLRRDWRVIATVRGSTRTPLHDLADSAGQALEIEALDINDPEQLTALHERLRARQLELLFVNAGVANDPSEKVGEVSTDTFTHVMLTNALGPLRAVETLAELVTRSGTIAVMSSGLGSVANNTGGGWEVYRASKAALNTLMRSYASRQRGARSLLLIAPGWVRTDMGGPGASLDVETSTKGIADTIASQAGRAGLRYLDYQGRQVAW